MKRDPYRNYPKPRMSWRPILAMLAAYAIVTALFVGVVYLAKFWGFWRYP